MFRTAETVNIYGVAVDIVIHDGMRSIKYTAFVECRELRSIVIPGNVISLSEGTFWRCTNLTDVTIPDGMHITYAMFGDSSFGKLLLLAEKQRNLRVEYQLRKKWGNFRTH